MLEVICCWSIGIDNFKWSPAVSDSTVFSPCLSFLDFPLHLQQGANKVPSNLWPPPSHNFRSSSSADDKFLWLLPLQMPRQPLNPILERHKSVMRFILIYAARIQPRIQLNKHSTKLLSRQLFSPIFRSRVESRCTQLNRIELRCLPFTARSTARCGRCHVSTAIPLINRILSMRWQIALNFIKSTISPIWRLHSLLCGALSHLISAATIIWFER